MSTTSWVVVRDPVPPEALFAACRQLAGAPGAPHAYYDYGPVIMLHAAGRLAIVNVTYAPDRGPLPREDEDPADPAYRRPDGYALAAFTTGGYTDDAGIRRRHARLVAGLGGQLAGGPDGGLRWAWHCESSPWWEPGDERRVLGDWGTCPARRRPGLRMRHPGEGPAAGTAPAAGPSGAPKINGRDVPGATWIARLGCGCEARVGSEPKIGGYLTCTSVLHQSSYRINGAVPIGGTQHER